MPAKGPAESERALGQPHDREKGVQARGGERVPAKHLRRSWGDKDPQAKGLSRRPRPAGPGLPSMTRAPKKKNPQRVVEEGGFGSRRECGHTQEGRAGGEWGGAPEARRALPTEPGRGGMQGWRGRAWTPPPRPPSSWVGALRVSLSKHQHQHPLQVRPAKCFLGSEPRTQVEAQGQEPICPTKETKAFMGPGLQVATGTFSLPRPGPGLCGSEGPARR